MTLFFIQNGVPEYVLIWIFMVPIAMTAIVAFRQIAGVRTLGIITPLLIGFAFMGTGAKYGAILFLTALLAGLAMRSLLGKFRLLYLPKIGLLLTGVAVIIIFLAPILPYQEELKFPEAVFSFIIFVLLIEQFASHLIERGFKKTFDISAQTLGAAFVIFFIITWPWLQDMVVSHSIFVLTAVIAINIGLGKWTGIRISEYIRFKDLIFRN